MNAHRNRKLGRIMHDDPVQLASEKIDEGEMFLVAHGGIEEAEAVGLTSSAGDDELSSGDECLKWNFCIPELFDDDGCRCGS